MTDLAQTDLAQALAGKTVDQLTPEDIAGLFSTSVLAAASKLADEKAQARINANKDAVFADIAAFATKAMEEKLGQKLFLNLRPDAPDGSYTCKTPVEKVKAKGKGNGNGTKRGESGKPTRVNMNTIISGCGALDGFTFEGKRFELQTDLAKVLKAQKGGFCWYEEPVGADGKKHGDFLYRSLVAYAIAHPGKIMVAFQANKTPRPLEVVAAEVVKASDGKLEMPAPYSIGGTPEANGTPTTTPVA